MAWDIFLTILSTVGPWLAGGLLAAVVAQYTGVLPIVLDFIGHILDIFKSSIQWIFSTLPKPFRVVVVIMLIVVLGGVLQNLVVAAPIICYEDETYTVGPINGVLFKLFPRESDEESVLSSYDNYNYTNAIDIPGVGLAPASYIHEQNLVQQVFRQRDYKTYYVLEGLVSSGDAIETDYGVIANVPQKQFFEETFGGGELYIQYNVCQARSRAGFLGLFSSEVAYENTCVLKPALVLDGGCDDVQSWWPLDRANDDWQWQVAKILYYYSLPDEVFSDNILKVEFDDNGILAGDLSDCELSSELESQLSLESQYISVTWNPTGLRGERTTAGNVYFTARGPLQSTLTEIEGEKVFFNVEEETYRLLSESRKKILENAEPIESSLGGLVTYSCNEESDDEYDVKTYFIGLDWFDPFVLGAIFVIGFLFALFSKFL